MLERTAHHHHGGDDINKHHYLVARVHDDGTVDLNVDKYNDLVNDINEFNLDFNPGLDNHQRALDDLVRCALDFGTTGSNDLWTCGVDDYDVRNLSHNDKARAAALLNAALDFAKATWAARYQVRTP